MKQLLRWFPIALFLVALLWLILLPTPIWEISRPTTLKDVFAVSVLMPDGRELSLPDAEQIGAIKTRMDGHHSVLLKNTTSQSIHIKGPEGQKSEVAPNADVKVGPTAAVVVNGFMPSMITVVLLIASLAVILIKRFTPTEKHWAYATVGTLLGYWLKH